MSDTPRTDALVDVTSPVGVRGAEMFSLCGELERALRRYGKHEADCLGDLSGRPCTCGLAAIIKGKP